MLQILGMLALLVCLIALSWWWLRLKVSPLFVRVLAATSYLMAFGVVLIFILLYTKLSGKSTIALIPWVVVLGIVGAICASKALVASGLKSWTGFFSLIASVITVPVAICGPFALLILYGSTH